MDIKLIIWDLDNTLWTGILAEVYEEIRLNDKRADIIRQLNKHGIVSSICSKNYFAIAKNKLEQFNLWDEFVFPRISFNPKAHVLQEIIHDMHLLSVNVLFIDDEQSNLEEALFFLPDINVVNAASPHCDELLQKILDKNKDIKKSRINDYKILQRKAKDRINKLHSSELFLRSCEIQVAQAFRMDSLDFVVRIVELINRSNQLNFTKSRVTENEIMNLLWDFYGCHCYTYFAWDKYGYYGLIGFAAVKNETKLLHFVFSCRTMHMGIENWVLSKLVKKFPRLDIKDINVAPNEIDWIIEKNFNYHLIQSKDKEIEASDLDKKIQIRIMADCQSSAIGHFSSLRNVAECDNDPRLFELSMVINNTHLQQSFPRMLVYGAFVDYAIFRWPEGSRELESGLYKECAYKFCEFVRSNDSQMIVILPPENAEKEKYMPFLERTMATRERIILFNSIWREIIEDYSEISFLDLSTIAEDRELIDARHYRLTLIKKIADQIDLWFASKHNVNHS